ncbi:uncharacterized protein [Rutidosis leptorrhynchoides]|uniref:uncharacterized protein n=1 Tax=Rutidosis leptorrhynchoides TaxID=125765 RepID=UPI003A9A2683
MIGHPSGDMKACPICLASSIHYLTPSFYHFCPKSSFQILFTFGLFSTAFKCVMELLFISVHAVEKKKKKDDDDVVHVVNDPLPSGIGVSKTRDVSPKQAARRAYLRKSNVHASAVTGYDHAYVTYVNAISPLYCDLDDSTCVCAQCGTLFWSGQRLKGYFKDKKLHYHRCCENGRVYLPSYEDPPTMFSRTSFGARVDDNINDGRSPYVFKVSGQIYHWIGALCPPEGTHPRFLQLYIYNNDNEVENRMTHFGGQASDRLCQAVVVQLIQLLDSHNELVKLFRTARDKFSSEEVPTFKVRLFSLAGSKQHALPTSDAVGAIGFDCGPQTISDYDVIIEPRSDRPRRVNKLYPLYMSLQYPLMFFFGVQGFHPNLMLRDIPGSQGGRVKKMSMNILMLRAGRLFQQYVVTVYCSIELDRMDYIRRKQKDIRIAIILLYTIEFQKRGLPHGHTLLWLHSTTSTPITERLDDYISAELPDPRTDPAGYAVISVTMMHGPCGAEKPCTPCKKAFASQTVDEIQNFIDARFIFPHEACWRIFNFPIHHRKLAVQMLVVHLENMHLIKFHEQQGVTSIVENNLTKKTTLTEWLHYNAFFSLVNQLIYLEFPSEFVWCHAKKCWKQRANMKIPSIGRISYIHPAYGEAFFLRMVLCNQKGCQSFEDIKTVNKVLHSTYRPACEVAGLLGDDKEWTTALEEASTYATASLLFCSYFSILSGQ